MITLSLISLFVGIVVGAIFWDKRGFDYLSILILVSIIIMSGLDIYTRTLL